MANLLLCSRPGIRQLLVLLLICLFAWSCGPKKLPPGQPPVEESPGTTAPPESGEPAPPPEEPAPPSKPLLTPPPEPEKRAPSKADAASIRLVEKGVKQLNAGSLDDAEQSFEQAVRVSPTNGRPYYYLGVIAAKQKDYQRSLGFLQQAEAYLSDDDFWMSQVLLQEGLAFKAMNDKKKARSKFQEALTRDAGNKWAGKELKELGD
jgi:tetratricopeptide (TPR) repeat protein